MQGPLLAQLALLQTQYNQKLFEKNPELKESVGGFLETIKNCLGYIANAIKPEQAPNEAVSGITSEKLVTQQRQL